MPSTEKVQHSQKVFSSLTASCPGHPGLVHRGPSRSQFIENKRAHRAAATPRRDLLKYHSTSARGVLIAAPAPSRNHLNIHPNFGLEVHEESCVCADHYLSRSAFLKVRARVGSSVHHLIIKTSSSCKYLRRRGLAVKELRQAFGKLLFLHVGIERQCSVRGGAALSK